LSDQLRVSDLGTSLASHADLQDKLGIIVGQESHRATDMRDIPTTAAR
jgi:hypothetical protein